MREMLRKARRSMVFAAVIGVWMAGGAMSGAHAAYHALVVGVDQYQGAYIPSYNWLESCVNDARGFRGKLLGDGARWKSGRITALLNSSATESAIKGRIRTKASALMTGDVFVYFHSSHGGQYAGTDTYLCTYASDFTDAELGRELARFRSGVKIFVVIDACHSAGMFKDGAGGNWPFAENVTRAYQEAKAKSGVSKKATIEKLTSSMAFMTACNYQQSSWAGDPYSVYVGHLLQACGTWIADCDPRNGYLSFWEAHAYAKPRTSQEYSRQTPQYRNKPLLQRTTLIRMNARGKDLVVPTLIGTEGMEANHPVFAWQSVSVASSYQLQVFDGTGRLVMDRAGIGGTGYTSGAKWANGTYRWRVRAEKGGHYSSWSPRVEFTVGPSLAAQRRARTTRS